MGITDGWNWGGYNLTGGNWGGYNCGRVELGWVEL